ncbi:helix-turn-helix domain-containing protein [Caldanaerobius polysaccharolyticus]|uniref:helix-turn-helix domain-containing protein n=1 Tax=Caldanaerobius polysaccharolyticus TaxID=44256 RepID=UPI000689D352|nr:helix-turn-helix transcriptional regulator [Caldanaerobius polysaccharolyticus]
MDKTLGQKLRRLREKKEWTQKHAAKVFGITNAALSNYERGERTPDPDMLKKFAEVYGVSIDFLVGKRENTIDEMLNENVIIKESELKYINYLIGEDAVNIIKDIGKLNAKEKELLHLFLLGLKAYREINNKK